jgi:hypothetical protein
VFDAWGLDRCLWGTDWTRAFAVVNYEQAVEPFLKTDRLSDTERAMLMGGACIKAYRWSPRKGYSPASRPLVPGDIFYGAASTFASCLNFGSPSQLSRIWILF